MEPLVSIIIPIYNTENYISKCIESILSQTYGKFELLLINDGSTDSSEVIVALYAKNDSRVKLINKENGGPSSARNMGLDAASGKYIMFVDSDDYIDIDMIKQLVSKSEEFKSDITACGTVCLSEGRELPELSSSILAFQSLEDYLVLNNSRMKEVFSAKYKTGLFNSLWAKLYRRDFISKTNSRFDTQISLGEDLLFNLPLFRELNCFVYINRSLYYYIKYDHQTLNNKYRSNMVEIKRLLHNAVINQLQSWEITDAIHKANVFGVFYGDIRHCISNVCSIHNQVSIFQKLIEIYKITRLTEVREMCSCKVSGLDSFYSKVIFLAIKYSIVPVLYYYGIKTNNNFK